MSDFRSEYKNSASHGPKIIAIGLFVAFLALMTLRDAHADAKDNAKICASGDKDSYKTNSGVDPCAEFHMNKTAATRQYISAAAHAVSTALCALQCSGKGAGCKLAVGAAMGTDVAGLLLFKQKEENITTSLMATFGPQIAGLGMGTQLFRGDRNLGKKSTNHAEGEEQTNTADAADKKQKDKEAACSQVFFQGLTTVSSYMSARNSMSNASKAIDKKTAMIAQTHDRTLGTSEVTAGNGTATQASNSDVKTNRAADPIVTPQELHESAATAGMLGPLMKQFQDETGAQNPEHILDGALAGINPLAAASAMASGPLGGMAGPLNSLANGAEQELSKLAQENGEDVSNMAFQSTGAGGSKASSSGDDGMPDMSGLLAGMAGGEEAPKDPNNVKDMNYSRRPSSAQLMSEGLHPPDRSLFDIIGNRYRISAARLLSGEPSERTPASGLPKNIYLNSK